MSRISPFGLREENRAKIFSHPSFGTNEKQSPTDLVRRGNSNLLARLPSIQDFAVNQLCSDFLGVMHCTA